MVVFFSTTSIIIACLSFLMGIFVYFKNPKSPLNKSWSLVNFFAGLWSLGLGLEVISGSYQEALFWNKILYLGAIPLVISFFYFVVTLLNLQKQKRAWLIIGTILTIIFLFFNFFSNLFVTGVPPMAGFDYWVSVGPIYYPYFLFYLLYISYGVYLLYVAQKKETGFKKLQIRYVLYSMVIGFGGGVTNFFPQLFNIYPFAHFLVIFYIILIGYAITRYRLMDIKTLVKRSSVFTFLVIIIAVMFATFSSLLFSFLSIYFGEQARLFSIMASTIIVVIIYDPIKKVLEFFTDKFLFVRSYNSSQVLLEINQLALSEIELSKLLISLEEKLQNIFYFQKIAFLFLNEKKQLDLVKQNGFDQKRLSDFSRGKENVLPLYFTGNNGIWVIPELKTAYDSGQYFPKKKEILLGLYDMDINLVVPLFVKEDLIGIILLGDKKSGDSYNQEDLNIIGAIAGQLAMAIENARFYEKQKQFNIKLKQEVKKATAKLESANKELQRLDDAKSEFLSIASHQLRTPTTIIKGYISMMQEGSFGKLSKNVSDNLNKVYIATERLLNLIENLLDISRIESGRLEFDIKPLDLTKLADELKTEFEKKAKEKKLTLSTHYSSDLPLVMTDSAKIKEVASNLVDNAIKYTPKGEVSIELHQEGSSVVFCVSDTGIGIAVEDLSRLFNKFVRGSDMNTTHPEGTGLGLYFARVVIENLGGRIWVESVGKGRGSKFCFSLPLADKRKSTKVKAS